MDHVNNPPVVRSKSFSTSAGTFCRQGEGAARRFEDALTTVDWDVARGAALTPGTLTDRRAQRAALLAAREALSSADHRRLSELIRAHLVAQFAKVRVGVVGFYYPVRRECDPLPFVKRLVARGATAALPVVVGKDKPLEFRPWEPGVPMAAGPYGIPEPATGPAVIPDAILIPLVGFDANNFRLGYGGGYYDRTLAGFDLKPLIIGIGFELGRLPMIVPQAHDIALDFVVTEAGVQPRRLF